MELNINDKYFDRRDAEMCDRFKNAYLKNLFISAGSQQMGKGNFLVKGTLKFDMAVISGLRQLYLQYWSSSPAIHNSSFSGSGLPYPNEEIAFDNTPSAGVVPINLGSFSFYIHYPNSFYKNLGTTLVPPSVFFRVVDENSNVLSPIHSLKLGEPIPFRSESMPVQRNWLEGPLFYKRSRRPIQSQWKTLVEHAYPVDNNVPKDFWGPTNN